MERVPDSWPGANPFNVPPPRVAVISTSQAPDSTSAWVDIAIDNTDRSDARKREIASQSTDNRSWIYRNINPVLGLIVVLLSFVFFAYVLQFDFEKTPAKKDVVIYLLGSVSGLVTMVVGYFYGSSHNQNRRKPPTDQTD